MYNDEYYCSSNDYRNYISHHGIKGQKWGVRHGPPYPLEKATSSGIIKRAKKKADKKPDKKKLAKRIHQQNVHQTQQIQQQLMTQQHIRNHQQMVEQHNLQTQQHIHQVHMHSMMFGKDAPKEDVKEPLDKSKMTEWEKKTVKGGYVINNPSGFEEGTTFTHTEYERFSTDQYAIDDADAHIVISKTTWNDVDPNKIYKNESLKPKEATKDEIISLQKSLVKNHTKIANDVIDSIADNIFSESKESWFPEKAKGKTKAEIAKMIHDDIGVNIRAVPVKVPNGDGYTIEVTVGDGYIYNGHILTKEVYYDPRTGKYKIVLPDSYQMDG